MKNFKSQYLILPSLFFGPLTPLVHAEPQIICVVRHAERSDATSGPSGTTSDPGLSETGLARAKSLGNALRDAGITVIYATEYRRTQQTAAPLAKSRGITVTIVPARETLSLLKKLKTGQGNALVVGHSNTVAEIIKALGIATPLTVSESDYDNLFVVTSGAPARLIHLHY